MKIFVLLSRFPYPLEKGDKLRAYNQIREISKKHEVILCALNEGRIHPSAVEQLSHFCSSVNIIQLSKVRRLWSFFKAVFNGIPFQVAYFYQCKAKYKIQSLIEKHQPDIIFCQLLRVVEYMKEVSIPKVLDYQDVFSKGIQRRINTASFLFKPLLKEEFRRLLKYEHFAFELFENKTIISDPDRQLIPHPRKDEIVVVPNGVDTDYYHPIEREKKYDLIFSGNMGYPPNVNSAEFLVKKILPLVHLKMPEVNLIIAGANPSAGVLALRSKYVTITGWVEDMRECYASARIFIAPMQIGTGLQNKLIEAMSMQLPCITSALANNALGSVHEKEILVGNSAEEYVEFIVSLLNDPAKANEISLCGLNFVLKNYNWETHTSKLITLFESIIRSNN
jgi:polysaccharide biosynthesis protein PslH